VQNYQTSVGVLPAPGVEGDFASADIRATVLAGPGALVTAASDLSPFGLTCGRFFWVDPTGVLASNSGPGAPAGFVKRSNNALIVHFLDEASMVIPPGFAFGDGFLEGVFWARSKTNVTINQKVYAYNADGTIATGATGTPPSGSAYTASIGAIVTGSIAGNTLTVSAVAAGAIEVGSVIPAQATGITAATVTAILTGTGGAGTYTISGPAQTIASQTININGTNMIVTNVASGTLGQGDAVAGSGVTAGTVITDLGTSTGGTGTVRVSPAQHVTSESMTSPAATETKWYAGSNAQAGELFKLTSWPQG
jgi:hypothetical protein